MKLIARGVGVTTGIVWGKAKIINEKTRIDSIQENDILVIDSSNPMYALYLFKASGLLIRNGARLAHICLIATEMEIPCITQIGNAIINENSWICVDGKEGCVYEK